jgi:hypothetical protein
MNWAPAFAGATAHLAIPAQAGPPFVIPAQAGIQFLFYWTPAFAGATTAPMRRQRGGTTRRWDDGAGRR